MWNGRIYSMFIYNETAMMCMVRILKTFIAEKDPD